MASEQAECERKLARKAREADEASWLQSKVDKILEEHAVEFKDLRELRFEEKSG